MTVVVLTAVPPALRGVLTRWLFEIAPGVYVGRVSARVRDLLWERIVDGIGRGRAILVHTARNEQGLAFRVHGHEWRPTDFDGLVLMARPEAVARGPAGARVRAGGGGDGRGGAGGGAGIGAGGAGPAGRDASDGVLSSGLDDGANVTPVGTAKSPPRNWSFAARRLRGR